MISDKKANYGPDFIAVFFISASNKVLYRCLHGAVAMLPTQINRRSVIEEMKGLQLLSRNRRISWSGEMVETPQERKQNKSCDSPE
jgi:hypothetical protein